MNENTNPDGQTIESTDDDRPWEPLNGRPLRVGDEVRRDHGGVTSIAVVGRVDKSGDPWTAEGKLIGLLRYGTWYVRRTVQELPTELCAVIVAKEEGGSIEATVLGAVWRARESVLGGDGRWYGIWRTGSGRVAVWYVRPDHITPGTWKVDDQ